jgi:hypothetical protein
MVRANRHYIPGQVWHITHRCHNRAKGRRIETHPEELCVLREESAPYNADFAPKNEALSAENAFFETIL